MEKITFTYYLRINKIFNHASDFQSGIKNVVAYNKAFHKGGMLKFMRDDNGEIDHTTAYFVGSNGRKYIITIHEGLEKDSKKLNLDFIMPKSAFK